MASAGSVGGGSVGTVPTEPEDPAVVPAVEGVGVEEADVDGADGVADADPAGFVE